MTIIIKIWNNRCYKKYRNDPLILSAVIVIIAINEYIDYSFMIDNYFYQI